MGPRDPGELHRQSTFLELFFDLCFVVAVASAAAELHHALAGGHIAAGLISYLTVFFAIWWAWMNFTWFASAYDNDDVPYRLATLVQIVGALILAAGVAQAFEDRDFDTVFVGYAVIRLGLIAMWLRAARHDPARRLTAYRFAGGLAAAMAGWSVMFLTGHWPLWGWWLMAAVELAVPVWAESAANTSWHPRHIAERYGLFTIIVLGESVLAATRAVQSALSEDAPAASLIPVIGGGLLIMFSLWWLYFAKPAHRFLTSNRVGFMWGYGHYFIFASAAAVGTGLTVNLDGVLGRAELSGPVMAATVTVPVAAFLATLWLLQVRYYVTNKMLLPLFPAAAVLVLLVTFTGRPILATGAVATLLAAIGVILMARAERRAVPDRARASSPGPAGSNSGDIP